MNQQNDNYRKPNRPDKRDLLKKRKPMGAPQSPSNGKGSKKSWPMGHRIAFVLFLVILGLFLWKQMNPENANRVEISYSEFNTLLLENKLRSVKIHNSTLDGVLTESMTLGREGAKRTTTNITVNIGTYDQTFPKELVDKNIEVTIIPEKTWMTMIISVLPWIVILGVWLFILKQMQGGPKGVFSFGKSKAKLMEDHQQKVTFSDVAGVEEAKVELQEVIEFLTHPKKFQILGGKIPKGALLIGPPGTGKTLLARAVAGEAGVPFFSMSGSDFVEMFVGVGASRVRDLFEQGKSNAPCILFIDEIDAVGRQRGAGIGGGHDEREQTLNQLLVEMDGFESNDGVILLAATNRPDVLDPALLRPGRFDRQIIVDYPDVKARKEILKVHAKDVKVGRNINLGNIAKGTPGMTGADLANVVNEAALLAARLNHRQVLMADFEEAKDKVMMGSARKSLIISDEEKKLTACHEAGHVLVSRFVDGSDPVHKVSIVARGRALGLTHFLPIDEKHNWSYTYIVGKLTVLLGGRAAEIIKFNDMTNGASNDIENATKLARKMVCEWGMSKRLGPLALGKKDNEVFLGREITTHKDYSEETAIAIDQEVRKIIEAAQQHAEKIIRENIDKLDLLTDELLKQEILSGFQIDQIFDGKPVYVNKRPSRRRRRKPASSKQGKLSDSGNEKNEPQVKTTALNDKDLKKTEETKVNKSDVIEKKESPKTSDKTDKPEKSDKNDKTDNGDKSDKKGKSSKSSKSRMIRLKIGGRRRVIKKAPAQKIRKIN